MTTTPIDTRPEILAYGPVHLNVVSRDRSLRFWRDIVGLRLRSGDAELVELGTAKETILVLHPGATGPVRRGHRGLYHVAIYVPGDAEFARLASRLIARRARFGATDHVMARSLYLNDPDGIGLELALQTPERFGRVRITDDGIEVFDARGQLRSGNDPFDVRELLSTPRDPDLDSPLAAGTTMGHLHLSVADLDAAIAFYRDAMGFTLQNYWPHMGMADFHAGYGPLHRLAINVWNGPGAPPAPPGGAGLRDATFHYDSIARLRAALSRLPDAEQTDRGYRVRDADGNTILLTGPAAGEG